jgi:hypothetical protein
MYWRCLQTPSLHLQRAGQQHKLSGCLDDHGRRHGTTTLSSAVRLLIACILLLFEQSELHLKQPRWPRDWTAGGIHNISLRRVSSANISVHPPRRPNGPDGTAKGTESLLFGQLIPIAAVISLWQAPVVSLSGSSGSFWAGEALLACASSTHKSGEARLVPERWRRSSRARVADWHRQAGPPLRGR